MNDMKKNVGKFYEREALEYDELRWASEVGSYIDFIQRELILQMVEQWSGIQILEVGTGTGRFALELAQKGARVTAVDISSAMLKVAQRKFAEFDFFGEFVKVNATELPLPENYFDGCICVNVLSHISEHQKALKGIAKVVKTGGFFISNFPNLFSFYFPYGMVVNTIGRSVRRNVYTHWYSLSSIEKIYHRAGFRIIDIKGQFHFPSIRLTQKVLPLLMAIDRSSRDSLLKYIAPTLFIKGIKM